MFSGEPREIEITDAPALDAALEGVVAGAGVFVLHAAEGEPFIGRSGLLRRRLKRLLAARERPSRILNLRNLVRRIEYWPVASRLESSLVLYDVARRYLPRRYLEFLKLRMPAYVRLMVANEWPRTQITTKLGPRSRPLLRSVPDPARRRGLRARLPRPFSAAPLSGGAGAGR